MSAQDIPACTRIINHAIAQGSSTAHEGAFDEAGFAEYYFKGAAAANVVLHAGRVVGFQSLFAVKEAGVYSVGSFTDQQNPAKGAGAALFAKTQEDCRTLGGTSIIAKITSDNVGGLAYYSKMGFQPDAIRPADFTRADGRVVDRIVKRFLL